MKRRNHRLLLMTIVCMTVMMMFSGISASAASKPKCASKITMKISTSDSGSYICNPNIYLSGLTSDAQILSVKSSSKKVSGSAIWPESVTAEVKMISSDPYKTAVIKNGEKTNFTIKVKQKGKTYTLKTTVKFVKQTNPVKTIKLDGKSYSSFKQAQGFWEFNAGKKLPSKIKVNVNLKPGYKIASLSAEYYAPGWARTDSKPIKNGQKISTKYQGGSLCGIFINYYELSDLQGVVSASELLDTYGACSTSIQINFKK